MNGRADVQQFWVFKFALEDGDVGCRSLRKAALDGGRELLASIKVHSIAACALYWDTEEEWQEEVQCVLKPIQDYFSEEQFYLADVEFVVQKANRTSTLKRGTVSYNAGKVELKLQNWL